MLDALKEQQEVNRKLKDYVDRILVDVLERAPHLLEVRPNWTVKFAIVDVLSDVVELERYVLDYADLYAKLPDHWHVLNVFKSPVFPKRNVQDTPAEMYFNSLNLLTNCFQ